jgi:hypothetical protein
MPALGLGLGLAFTLTSDPAVFGTGVFVLIIEGYAITIEDHLITT